MASNLSGQRPPGQSRKRLTPYIPWRDVLDWLALLAWGTVLLKYWLTGKIFVLLHPDYMWLSNSAGFALLFMAAIKGGQLIRKIRSSHRLTAPPPHFSLLPNGIGSALLLAVAVFGLIYTPRAFASDTALQRGITDTLNMTRSRPQEFRLGNTPEDRTIIDWVRTLNVYPEPDAYTGQTATVTGFVIHPPGWPEDYLMISRFVLTCCAADAYPVGLPVKVAAGDRADYPPDTWLDIEGTMVTDTLDDRRQLVIEPTTLTAVPEPRNPYEY
ncbi:MAG: TIGR03943 family protein [Cyanobacteria bacterium J06635_15]